METLWLTDFASRPPPYRSEQAHLLDWMAEIHADSVAATERLDGAARDELRDRLRRVIGRCACGPDRIATRGHSVPEGREPGGARFFDPAREPHGPGAGARSRRYAEVASAYFEEAFAADEQAPRDIVHVTCTGYVSPSGAQLLVARRGWGALTRVTHAYHMGCYAALPALRIAAGCAATQAAPGRRGAARVELCHTELCSLHFDPALQTVEQFVVQSLFADGFIRYALAGERGAHPGLRLLATGEEIVPDSADAMGWMVSDHGMEMTLARDVPERIAARLRGFVTRLCERAGIAVGALDRRSLWAVHPGGPRVIDGVRDVLELSEGQVAHSRAVLRDHGNMSSATLPHVWQRMLADGDVRRGTLVASLAFGPGLTVAGALLRKE